MALALAAAGGAQAADMPLRGSLPSYDTAPVADWGGFYIGGFYGYSNTAINTGPTQATFAAAQSMTLPPSTVTALQAAASSGSVTGHAFGAFVGYNIQFEDVVVGIEADYTRQNAARSDSLRTPDSTGTTNSPSIYGPPGTYYIGQQVATARVQVSDYMTFRARAGWDLGYFMPFATAGVAIGRGTESNQYTALVCPGSTPGCGSPTVASLPWQRTVTAAGLAYGAGVDIRLARYLLLRAEYQGVSFSKFGSGPVTIHTARVGAGLRF